MKKSVREHIIEMAGAGGITPEIRAKILASDPEADWVRVLNQKIKYVPVEICRDLLTILWPGWSFQAIEVKQVLNAVVAVGRLHLPEDGGVVRQMDGAGAAALQTDAGSGSLNFDKLKSGALELAVPKALTQAEKNACDRLGRVFGFHLNKTAFDGASDFFANASQSIPEKIADLAEDGTTPEAFGQLYAGLSAAQRAEYTKAIIEAAGTLAQLKAIYTAMSKEDQHAHEAALKARKAEIKGGKQ